MTPREAVEEIFKAALQAADPTKAVKAHAASIRSLYESGGISSLMVLGFGKASVVMAIALEESIGDLITSGIVITKHGHLGDFSSRKIRGFEAGHPVPDERGLAATAEALSLLQTADEKTLVVCLISGGGSALLVSPHEGVSLSEKQDITGILLKAGADINELNAVRKHLSSVKGGRLAKAAFPARILSLIVSDVVGDRLDVIASGPTAPDASTYKEAMDILNKYSVTKTENVMRLLEKGLAGQIPDTPKAGDDVFTRVENIIIGSNRGALAEAKEKAKELGFISEIIFDPLTGEARKAANRIAARALTANSRPACLISGGETTVTVKGSGKGGRNTELALAFAIEVAGKEGITLLSAGTDGTDGPTDAAGAVVDGNTVARAKDIGLDAREYLMNNDSYSFFQREGGLVKTGPTGTNVMDVQVVLLEDEQ